MSEPSDHNGWNQRQDEPTPSRTSTIATSVEDLDLATIIRALQAVSGEMVPEKLVDTLLRTAIEHAGAVRGVLISLLGNEPQIEAEAATSGSTVMVHAGPVAAAALPESIVHYVARTQENLVLGDAAVESPFSQDPYIRQHRARSVLCLPLMKQTKLEGVLYLENNLAPNVFTPARIAVIRLLASQAAVSLENTRLYDRLQERERRIRRLLEANIIGIVICSTDGRITEANEAFLGIVGYGRDDLASGSLWWTDMTPDDWQKADEAALAELAATGVFTPFEKEFVRKDGRRVPVLVGGGLFERSQSEGVAFVLDVTERKHTEDTLRESERRNRDAQMELAHANRVMTMGQLTASIAHEVNQPIGATIFNASAALRWLAKRPPDLKQVRQALRLVIEDSNRASDVISRIHAFVKKAPPPKERLDINETIREVVALTRGEVQKHGVSSRVELTDGLPLIFGDRIQLQQVILNLITNAVQAMSSVAESTRELQIGSGMEPSGGVLVAIRDSGPGLPPETLDHIFQSFYTTKPDGLGMGLSICRSIIEGHDGRLWASANVPRGAIFQFTLPVLRDISS